LGTLDNLTNINFNSKKELTTAVDQILKELEKTVEIVST